MSNQVIENTEDELDDNGRRREWIALIDDQELRFPKRKVTGRELMAAAGIPEAVGLVQILEGGIQETVRPEDVVDLKGEKRFHKAPTFRRG